MESLREVSTSHLQPTSERGAALGWIINEGLSAPRFILPQRFLSPEFAEVDVLHRLGTLRVDQTVLVPVPPLYRLEHLREQLRSNSWTHVGVPADGDPTSTPPGRFPFGRCQRANAVELFAQAFYSSTRAHHVSQDFRRCNESYIPAFEPPSARDLISGVKLCVIWGNGNIPLVEVPLRSGRRQLRLAGLIEGYESRVEVPIYHLGGRFGTLSGLYPKISFGSPNLRRTRNITRLTH